MTVAPEVPATATFLANQLSQNSPALAVHPKNPRFVAMASRIDGPEEFGCALHVSGDRGRTWLPTRPILQLPGGVEHCYAPETAFDRTGRLYYLFVGLAGQGNTPMGVFLTSSSDYGRTFSIPIRVLGSRKYAVRMAIDPTIGKVGRIHLVWLSPSTDPAVGSLPLSDNPILAAYSDDRGQTFSAPTQVSEPHRRLVVAPALTLGPKHSVHVAYYDLGEDRRDYQGLEGPPWDGVWSIVSVSSTDGGARFDRSAVVNGDVVPPERVMLIFTMPPPAIAAGYDNDVYVAWCDGRSGDWDIFVSHSTDAGRAWSLPYRVNDDAVGNGRHQYMPRLSISPSGRLDAIFYDRRDDDQNTRNNVYHTFSDDGGRSFAPNRKITSKSFSSSNGSRYPIPSARGLVEFGSRIALVSRDTGALAAWTDTRLSPPFVENQDIFVTDLTLPDAAAAGPAPALFVIGCSIALLASSGAVLCRRWGRRRK